MFTLLPRGSLTMQSEYNEYACTRSEPQKNINFTHSHHVGLGDVFIQARRIK